jgi:hypothetical protein
MMMSVQPFAWIILASKYAADRKSHLRKHSEAPTFNAKLYQPKTKSIRQKGSKNFAKKSPDKKLVKLKIFKARLWNKYIRLETPSKIVIIITKEKSHLLYIEKNGMAFKMKVKMFERIWYQKQTYDDVTARKIKIQGRETLSHFISQP